MTLKVSFVKGHARLVDRRLQSKLNKPYQDLDITSITTGLPGIFQYSPKFNSAYATTTIKLTGSRLKDYLEAEKKVNCKHIPKKTVWHHVWERNQNGEYTIQLVDYKRHQSTLPHAGGCKMWQIENGRIYRGLAKKIPNHKIYINSSLLYRQTTQVDDYVQLRLYEPYTGEKEYNDFIIDAVLSDTEREKIPIINDQNRGIYLCPWGIDPFGDLFYVDKKRKIYFFDTGMGTLYKIGITTDSLMRSV